MLIQSIPVAKQPLPCTDDAARGPAADLVVMFWSYLSLADRDLFHPYDRMNNQSDYETRLPRKLVRRHRLAHPAGGIRRRLRVGSRRRGSNLGGEHPSLPDASPGQWSPAHQHSHSRLAKEVFLDVTRVGLHVLDGGTNHLDVRRSARAPACPLPLQWRHRFFPS